MKAIEAGEEAAKELHERWTETQENRVDVGLPKPKAGKYETWKAKKVLTSTSGHLDAALTPRAPFARPTHTIP